MTKKDLAVYIHIPFCVRKCPYCDFVSGPAPVQTQSSYVRTLMKEIRSYQPLGNLYEVKTIFFGGGTPSVLDPVEIMRILTQLRDEFIVARDAEITIECNPGTLTAAKLADYRRLGFNRLSIGLQSADDGELRALGRIHDWETFLENYRLAREAGFANINVDLMSGIPGQTAESWADTLRRTAELAPEHISAYSLIVEEGTPFYALYAGPEGQALLPSEEEEREMYHFTKRYLAEQGYGRYEISNYAKEGRESRHNITYWTGGDYLGFGLNASSYLEGRRFTNPSGMEAYREYAGEACAKSREAAPLTEREKMEEFMFLGLRMTRGISVREFEERFHTSFDGLYGQTVRTRVQQGFMTWRYGRVAFTDRGLDVSNSLLVDFLLDG